MVDKDMKFRTIVVADECHGIVSHEKGIFTIGSCFAENVGEKLRQDMFTVMTNPLGTVYNPASIFKTIERIAGSQLFVDDDLFEREGKWRAWDCHTLLSGKDRKETLERLNDRVVSAREFIRNAGTAIITLGTSFVFELKESGRIVANCHKMPSGLFKRRMLETTESEKFILQSIDLLRKLNPEIEIIVTVSPIRHTADGAHGNFISKAKLAIALDVCRQSTERLHYFPSYEIMMDDLRDYRFYAEDMKHPSAVAVEYIYSEFCRTYFDEKTAELAEKGRKISKRKAHRMTDASDRDEFVKFQNETERLEREFIEEIRKRVK